MRVKKLSDADVVEMRGANALFAAAFAEPDTYLGEPPPDGYLRAWLMNTAHVMLVAQHGEDVVGALAAYVLTKFERSRSEVYIYDLAVSEHYRRRGIATALIGALQKHAADIGAYVIFVQADHGDDPAIALYEKLGEREEVLHFDIPIEA